MATQKQTHSKKLGALMFLCLLAANVAFAKQIPTVVGILKTNATFVPAVTVGMPTAINTIQVPVVAATKDYKIQNTISLKYDLNTDTFFLAPATVRVKVTIARWDVNNVAMTTISRKLSVNINNKLSRALLEQSSVNLIDGYKITTTIDSIWVNGVFKKTLPRYVSVEAEINMDRYYDFSSNANTIPAHTNLLVNDKDCDGVFDDLKLTWSVPAAVPEEYQLEWTFVNNYTPSGIIPATALTTDFNNNSTRITTTSNSYKITLIYPSGYIVFRVRAVGRNYLNPSEIIYGRWNINSQNNIGALSTLYWWTVPPHDKLKNWQYSGTFAEEGKSKEVVSYFDGSLRNRQTVTKLNSSTDVIVGETLYDFQGRPAVNVLPVPVNLTCANASPERVLRYYKKFNVDDTNKVYSKNDFDLDASGACNTSAAPMDTTLGASQYYSSNNPNKNLQQSYVPHAKEYPFTQVEYTPDNTGRIRRQSGVGKDYKLGSGKETKYLYGQPNQLQVDRLFGSETGDASHYKKNVVIDANGQASVTYLNQEGKTIATALAGVPPTIGLTTVTRLDSLDYAAQNQAKYTVDLFNKNSQGLSKLNTVPASGDQLSFSSQLLVPFKSVYDFNYNFQIDVLPDGCLRPNICVSCVYDLELQIKDECGVDLVSSVAPFKPFKRTTGNVDTTGGKLTFNVTCLNPTLFKDSAKVSLVLNPGVYTVNKILKVNQLAKDYYVKKYIDSTYNACVSTLYQYQAAELALVDTSDCYNSCASCLAALGTRDDFVSAGNGTAEQWDILAAQCNEPCRQKTLCQITHEMMLSDVSPGGQYGKFNSATYDAFSEPISVFNVNNVLNPNTIPSQQAHWKAPLLRLNGNIYNYYLDDNGIRTKINLAETTPGVFSPPVTNPALVYLDNSTNVKYTYPENLQNLADFIAIWNPGYARSLVVFHPEYAYYVSCLEQSIKFPGDARTSDDLDSLLFASESFAQALANGFIKSNYLNSVPAITKIQDIWQTATGPYDPFFTNTAFQYNTVVNAVTGAQTSINMAGSASYNVNLQSQMAAIINNYKTVNSVVYTMADVAAILARCGNNFSYNIQPACLSFGTNFYGSTPPTPGANDTIRNKEWRIFRQLYFAEKQKLQFKRMDFYAKYGNDLYSNYYGGCNACIGNSGYSLFNSGMVTLTNLGFPNSSSPYFDTSQPCGFASSQNYAGVVKRFYDPATTGLTPENAALQIYQATGQCPQVFQLQNFLNAMTKTGKLAGGFVTSLDTVGEFGPDLYASVNGGPPSNISYKYYQWSPLASPGGIFTANIIDASNAAVKCTITIDKNGTLIPSFASIIGISQMVFDPAGTGPGSFKAVATYVLGGNTLSANVRGNVTCMNLADCSFALQCVANPFAKDMGNLLSYLRANNLLSNTVATPISTDPNLNLLLTSTIKNTLGSPNTNIVYKFVAPDQLTFYDVSNPSSKIVFTYIVSPSGNEPNIKSFDNIKGNNTNAYTMEAFNVNGVKIADVSGVVNKVTSAATTSLSMGICALPDPVECSEKEHQVRKDLEALVNEVLSTKPFNTNVNIYNLASYSSLLKSYEPANVNSTNSSYVSGLTATPNYDTLTIKFNTTPASALAACNVKLYHYRNNGTILNFANVVSVTNLSGIGTPDIAGNYFYFKALATYVVGANPPVTDTIYGYSCWPIKNCTYCKNPLPSGGNYLANTYNYSTGFDRINNTMILSNGFDPNWVIIKTQQTLPTAPYTLVGTPTTYGSGISAYDITNNTFWTTLSNARYVNINADTQTNFPVNGVPAGGLPPQTGVITYKTTFNLPNPLNINEKYELVINTLADDGIFGIRLNGTSLFSGQAGGFVGPPVSVTLNTANSSLLLAGANSIEIDHFGYDNLIGMSAQVLVNKYISICSNGPPDSTFVFPPYTKYDNPCVRQKINLALQNAANKYQQYINDITTTFANAYTQHCLSALEKYTYKYVDKEYHHTLYYYDQAGNLVKTIPPEGVEYLPITAYTDNLAQKIISDRTTGQQNVFTTHRMATKYVYNSLNQLIFQSLPDHDNMDICDGLNPNGLDTGLVINAVQFVNPNKGYLCGYLKRNGGVKRGYMYTSADGGNSWTRINGVTSGDMQKVQFTTSSNGFAVSNFGMVFRTQTGGTNWDLLTGLYNPGSGTRYVGLLTDLHFTTTNGLVGGIMQTGGTPIYYTTNGGNTFNAATVSGATVGDTITGFTLDGTTYIASTKNGTTGKIFTSINNGVNWTQVVNFAGNNLRRVQFINNSLAFAVGEEGTLMKLNQQIIGTANPIFQLVPTGQTGRFVDVYFKNATEGVAIIDSVPNKGKLFKTFDGGLTWQLLSANGYYYNSLKLFDATNHKLIAGGKNGQLAKVLLTTSPFGIINIGTPNTNNISFADAYNNGSNGLIAIGVSDISPLISTCYDAQLANPTWLTINTTLLSPAIPPVDATFKKVILLDSSASTPYIKGVLLTTNGKLYSFYRKYNTVTMICRPITLSGGFTGKFFIDITANGQTFTSPIYAFDTISKRNYQITFAGTVGSGAVFNNFAAISKNINAIDIHNSTNSMIMVGNSGHIEYTQNVAATTTWAEVTLTSIPVALTKVKTISANNYIATGIDGALYKNVTNASTWYLKNSGTAERINSMAVDATGNGLIAANNGKLFRLTGAQSQVPLLSNIVSGQSAHLTDVALEPAGTSAYVTAADGQVLYMTNYNSPVPAPAAPLSPFSANGVAYKSGPNAAVVGNSALIANYFGTSAMTTKDIFPRGLISLNFFDANNGYVIDSMDVIRKTADGGATWSVVLPLTGAGKLTKVFSTQANSAVIIGLNKYVARASGATGTNLSALSTAAIPAATNLYDINYNSSKTVGYIVGSNTWVFKIVGNAITLVGQPQTTAIDLRAVHVFNNNTFITAGTAGKIYYYKGSFKSQTNYTPLFGLTQANITFRDIYFHDDYMGYVVGSSGAAYKVILTDSIGTIGNTANNALMAWKPFCATALYMGYTTGLQKRKTDFNAIAFSSRSDLMIAGADSNLVIGTYTPNRYARLLKEQSGYYSTRFWYDKLGRLTLSQNTRQFNKTNPANVGVKQAFSYTLYDALGRITEVGEKYENHTGGSPQMQSIFGSFVNGYYNNSALDDAKYLTWLNSTGSRREVTKTYYDAQSILSIAYTQKNLRKRVATTTFEDVFDGNNLTYNHATHYSYDIHGNVSTLWQENTQLGVSGQGVKQVDYQYDLISGKVNKVIYSPGQLDQFIHRYSYDADNRITQVETSTNDLRYDLEAKYFYYAHGPLARVEYGKNQVQGVDYAYTLQGWIKGINSDVLKKAKDMGSDGDLSIAGNPNANFARDIMGYSLKYYKGDYEAINFVKWNTASKRFEAYNTSSNLLTNTNDLYNGNIGAMVTTISKIDTNSAGVITGSRAFPLGNAYRYDQLNRLKRSYSYTNLDTLTNAWLNGSASNGLYRNIFTYDANGNIKTQVKRDSIGGLTDSLVYNYEKVNAKLLRNRLYHVNDFVTTTPANFGDIKDQGVFASASNVININNNYRYDEIGNLIADKAEKIDTIRWMVTGKIKAIIRTPASTKDNLYFDYDASGNRIAKHVYTSANVWKYSTYYVRDAQGNVMSEYDKKTVASVMSYKLNEQHLYGSSRLGMYKPNFEMIGAIAPPDTVKYYLGRKQYELSNHLGNVITTITDKKISVNTPGAPFVINYYVADMTSSTDYYAFGSPMPGRRFNNVMYRYGMNGKEKDDEISGSGNNLDFGARHYDPRLGRWWSIDNKYSKYPEFSPYVFGANNPIFLVDADGNDIYPYHITGLDETGNSVYTKGQVSAKTEAVIKDMLKTPEGLQFFSQFAKKGQTLAGYTFKENGALSNHDLSIFDYSLENLETNLPSNVEGTFGGDYNPAKNNINFKLSLVTLGETQESIGETATHETQLHGKKRVQTYTDAFKKGGKTGFDKAKEAEKKEGNALGDKDHTALKKEDPKSDAYKNYKKQKDELIKVNPKYKKGFEQGAKDAKEKY